eukprot:g8616.t1
MLTRKQQWRRTRVRRASRSCADGKKVGIVDPESDKLAESDQTTLSTRSSFDSLRDADDVEGVSAQPAPATERSVSFQEEVEVFLVNHKSELATSVKQALWWTGRDAAMNKRAWLHHLGQPGCGRQSVARPRPKHQQQHQEHHHHQHHHQDRSPHFLGGGRNTAAGRGRGIFTQSNNNGSDFVGEEALLSDWTESVPADGVGILGCRCHACLTEGEEHELDHEQQERLQLQRWRWEERVEPPPRYAKPPPPYNDQPPPSYKQAFSSATGAPQPVRQFGAARGASKSWPSPEDWDREDDLGGKGSRSYSPGSASGSSPLWEACETYDDEGSYFF